MSGKPLRLLEPTLLPPSCWDQSLSQLHKEGRCRHWPIISESSIDKHGSLCIHCDCRFVAPGQEIWQYDDPNGVIVLAEVVPMCENCRQVIHLGRSEVLAAEGLLDWKALIGHFCAVRQCKPSQFDAVAKEAFDVWSVRSRKQWRVDYGEFEEFVHEPHQQSHQQPDTAALEAIFPRPQTDLQRKPSETKHTKWLNSRKSTAASVRMRLKDGDKLGSFIISASKDQIDRIWSLVGALTAAGKLGTEAYANTALVDSHVYRPPKFVCGVVVSKDDDKDRIESDLSHMFPSAQVKIHWKPQVVPHSPQPAHNPTRTPPKLAFPKPKKPESTYDPNEIVDPDDEDFLGELERLSKQS